MYLKIVNPVSNRKVSIHSKLGIQILQNYLNYININMKTGGSSQSPRSHDLYEGDGPEERQDILKNGNIGDKVEYHTNNQLGYLIFEIVKGDEFDGKTLEQIGDIFGLFSDPNHPEYIELD